jgi:hypothetical protein
MLPEGAALAVALAEVTPDEWEPRLAAADFAWHKMLGVAAGADAVSARRAWRWPTIRTLAAPRTR